MYRLFTQVKPTKNVLKTVGFNRIKRYTDLIKNYKVGLQTTYGNYIPSDHILVKLCYSLIPYLEVETDTYRLLADNSFNINSPLKFTSLHTTGKIHNDAFYSTDCVIFSGSFDRIFEKTWQDIKPIKCLDHSFCSMSFDAAPTNKRDFVTGLSGVFIDVPLFGVKFKHWYLQNKFKSDYEQETIIQFIERYIIPELLESYLDICIRNRLVYLAQDKKPPKDRPVQSYISALESDIDREIRKDIAILRGYTRTPYNELLNAIPFLFSYSYYSAFPHEIDGLSNYSYAFQSLLTINWVYPLLYLISDTQLQQTISDIRFILVRAKRYRDTTGCLSDIPSHLRYEYLRKLSFIEEAFIS